MEAEVHGKRLKIQRQRKCGGRFCVVDRWCGEEQMMQKLEKDFKSHSELSKVSLRLEKKQGLEGERGGKWWRSRTSWKCIKYKQNCFRILKFIHTGKLKFLFTLYHIFFVVSRFVICILWLCVSVFTFVICPAFVCCINAMEKQSSGIQHSCALEQTWNLYLYLICICICVCILVLCVYLYLCEYLYLHLLYPEPIIPCAPDQKCICIWFVFIFVCVFVFVCVYLCVGFV